MKGYKIMQNRKNKGITLIALVVTIIVLLILARSEHNNVRTKSEF